MKYPITTVSFKDMTGGINLQDSITNLKPNESPFFMNYIWTQGEGLTSWPGNTLFVTVTGSGAIQFFDIYKPIGTANSKIMLAVRNGVLYSVNLGSKVLTNLLSGLSTSLTFVGCNFNGEYYLTNTTDGIIRVYYNGSTLTAVKVSGSPAVAYLCEDGKGRLYGIGATATPNRMYFCAFLNGTDWQTSGNAGYADVPFADTANSIKHNGESVFIGGSRSIIQAQTGNPFALKFTIMPTEVGTINQLSTILMDSFLRFLSPTKGLWAYQYYAPQPFGDKIFPAFAGWPAAMPGIIPTITLNLTRLNQAVAIQDGYFYRIALPKAGSSYNNCEIVVDTRNNTCGYNEGWNIGYWALDPDTGTVYGGDSVNGNIYVMNTGYTNNGSNIVLDYYSSSIDMGQPEAQKIGIFAKVQQKNSGSDQMSFGYLYDLGRSNTGKQLASAYTGNVWGTTNTAGILQWGTDPNNSANLWSSSAISDQKINMSGQGAYITTRIFSGSSGVSSQINILSYELAVVQLLPN